MSDWDIADCYEHGIIDLCGLTFKGTLSNRVILSLMHIRHCLFKGAVSNRVILSLMHLRHYLLPVKVSALFNISLPIYKQGGLS